MSDPNTTELAPVVSSHIDAKFAALVDSMSTTVQNGNAMRGFWEQGQDRNKLEMHALFTTEVAELTEAIRHKNPPSEHIPEFTSEEEELADIVIRVMDYAGGFKLRLGEAIIRKLQYNATRSYKHGKTC